MDANVDQLSCVLDSAAATRIPVEHKISYRAEWRVLRDPGSRSPALAHWHLHFQKGKVEAEDGMSAEKRESRFSFLIISLLKPVPADRHGHQRDRNLYPARIGPVHGVIFTRQL
jgi:hypothetical protein